jgi:hypothetical protein
VSLSSLWVAAPDYLPWLVLVGLPVVGVQATVVAARTVNVLASGRSAARPGAGPDVEHSPGATPPAAGECWAAGRGGVSPAASPGGPIPE